MSGGHAAAGDTPGEVSQLAIPFGVRFGLDNDEVSARVSDQFPYLADVLNFTWCPGSSRELVSSIDDVVSGKRTEVAAWVADYVFMDIRPDVFDLYFWRVSPGQPVWSGDTRQLRALLLLWDAFSGLHAAPKDFA